MPAVPPLRLAWLPLLVLSAVAATASAPAAAAQLPAGATYGVTAGAMGRPSFGTPLSADTNDPAEALARYLRALSDSPNDRGALTGAGHAALAIGDANAALAFYARAEEIAPRDGRIKAGLGSAMLQLEKPKEAIGLFDEATGLGVAEADIASDRGLAWDLRGDTRRAQRDYALALRANPDDETKRRMALSLAISGDEAGANALLDPLLRRQDRAAWRARAFILAMSGDVAKADIVARSAMSPAQVAAMHPFLARLASLRPAQKALAVNFGEMPSDGRTYSAQELAAIDGQPPIRLDSGLIPAGEPWGPRRAETAAVDTESGDDGPISTAPRRRPGQGDALALVERPTPVAAQADGVAFAARFATTTPASPPLPLTRPRSEGRAGHEAPHPQAAPTIAAPAAAAPAPIFFAAAAPPPMADVAAASSSPEATLPASASAEPSPSLSALDPAPRPVQLAALQAMEPTASPPASSPASPPVEAMPQDRPVALPPVGYRLPPAMPKPARAGEAKTVKPGDDGDAKRAASPKARAAEDDKAVGEKAVAKAKDAPLKPSARKDGAKANGDDAESATKKGSAKSALAKKATPDKDHDKGGKTTTKPDKKDAAKKSSSTDDNTAKKGGAKKGAADKAKEGDKDEKASAKKDDDKAKAKPDTKSDAKSAKEASQRVWVQVAGGATKGDLPKAWSKLKGKAPALAKGQSVYTTPLRATNRLLVGPFKSNDDAQAYVNKMGKTGMSGFTFTSDKGQQVDKLDTAK